MKTKKLRLFAIYIILPVLMLLTTSYAWFYINQQVELNYTPNIECEAGHSLEISVDGGVTWAGGVTLDSATPKMLDITGNGVKVNGLVNLFKPSTVDEYYQPQGFTRAEPINKDTGEGDYIEIEVKLRTNSKMDVYLSGDSFVSPDGVGSATNSIYGDFSKNCIAGAVRVSVCEKDDSGKETLKMLWDPNPYYKLTRNTTNGVYNGTYSFSPARDNLDAVVPQNVDINNYKYYEYNSTKNTYEIKTLSIEDVLNKNLSLGKVGGKDELTAGDSPVLTSFVPDGSSSIMYKTLVIRVWFEGTDREADQALSGGVIKMYFKFNGVNKSACTSSNQTAINGITYTGSQFKNVPTNAQYSYNGFVWHTYKEGQSMDIATYKTWYWRYPETADNLASAIKTITI